MPMPIPPVHPLPEGLIQESISGTWSPNSLRRNLHNQNNHVAGGGSRESAQVCPKLVAFIKRLFLSLFFF